MQLNFSENVRQLRKHRRITQEQLAEALGVTTGAVYKWENSLAMPEIRLLLELADFFETSVDYLLGYTVEKGGVNVIIKRILTLRNEHKLVESAREAEKALQKFPNNFELIYHSAMTYFLMSSQGEKSALRCIELLERACLLFEQNTYTDLTLSKLQEYIATCYIGLKQYDKTIELLKQLDVDGSQNAMIGMILAQFCHRPEEALVYLSDGFYRNLTSILRTTIGFAKAYIQLKDYDKAFNILKWMYDSAKGLRDTTIVTFLDKLDVLLLTMLADISERRGDTDNAYYYLRQALNISQHFDAAPEYRSHVGMNFYHGSLTDMSIDDFGDTAYLTIENYLTNDACDNIQEIWKEIKNEANE